MLILTLSKKRDPSFTITHKGEECTIYLYEILSTNRIQVGIDAPRSFAILRENAKVRTPKNEPKEEPRDILKE